MSSAGAWRRVQDWLVSHDLIAVWLAGVALYLPCAGSYGLWDPWESHYGEVARQMAMRHDYISLFWPGSPRETVVFQTKPVLAFWIMSLALRLFGLASPHGAAGELALGTRAEWALRTPFCLLATLGLVAIYGLGKQLAGRRAGLCAAAFTATMPMYALIARQAMTDMAYLPFVVLAVALGACAHAAPFTTAVVGRRFRALAITLFVLAVVPQLLVDSIDLHVHLPWRGRVVAMYGAVVMFPYWVAAALVVAALARTRRVHLVMEILAATAAGLGVLAKGLAGGGPPCRHPHPLPRPRVA